METDIVIDTPEGIAFFRMASLKAALKMELVGMKRRGRSAYSIVKESYGLKGTRESVYKQLCDMVAAAKAGN